METTSFPRRRLLQLACGVALAGLAGCAASVQPGAPDPLRNEVQRLVSGVESGLRSGGWGSVERYFSDDYRGNLSDLEDRFNDRRRQRRAADAQLQINRILTQDKLVSVSLHWLQRWTDLQGKPQKAEGMAELILRREGGELRIVDQRGNLF